MTSRERPDPECEQLHGRICNACLCNVEVPGYVVGCRVASRTSSVGAEQDPSATQGNAESSYRPDGTWCCIRDHRTTPCGTCSGCREVQAENALEGETRG